MLIQRSSKGGRVFINGVSVPKTKAGYHGKGVLTKLSAAIQAVLDTLKFDSSGMFSNEDLTYSGPDKDWDGVPDHEGLLRSCPTSVLPVEGARRVYNLCESPNDITGSGWIAIGSATTPDSETLNFPASAGQNDGVHYFVTGGKANETVTIRAQVSTTSGTCGFRLKNTHAGVLDNFSANRTATTTPQVFSFSVTNAASAGSGQYCGVVGASDNSSNSGSLVIENVQIEIKTGASDATVPSEFVEGCKYYNYANGNSVDGDGVVTAHTPGTLGDEELVDWDFETDTGQWVKPVGTAIFGGQGLYAGCPDSTGLSQNVFVGAGIYELTYEISGYSGGGLHAVAPGWSGTVRTANGVYTETVQAGSAGSLLLMAVGSTTLNVEYVSLKASYGAAITTEIKPWVAVPTTTNYLLNSFVPATQTVANMAAGDYTLHVHGSGSCALSGGPTGTASEGSPVTFTLASTTSVTFTVTGSLDAFQCNDGTEHLPFVETVGAPLSRSPSTTTGASSLINTTEGCVVFEFYPSTPRSGTGKAETVITAWGRPPLYANTNDANYYFWDGTAVASFSGNGWGTETARHVAIRWNDTADQKQIIVDGVAGTETGFGSWNGEADLQLFSGLIGRGVIRNLKIYKSDLGEDALVEATS